MTYLLYDTALNGPYTFMLLQQAYPVYQSLFKGTKDEALSDAAPYLFEVDELLYEKINGPLVSLEAIIILHSRETPENLCLHFKHFIYQERNGREHYCRFWDARVLNKILPEWPIEKLETFFEDIESFSFLNDEKTVTATRLSLTHGKLQKTTLQPNELFTASRSENEQIAKPVNNIPEEKPAEESISREGKPKRKFFYE